MTAGAMTAVFHCEKHAGELSDAIVERISPLLPVKGGHKPYFLHHEPNLWNGSHRVLASTRDWICLTRGLTAWKCVMHSWQHSTLLHSTVPCNAQSRVVACSPWLYLGGNISCLDRRNFAQIFSPCIAYNWASSKSLGGCSSWHSFIG